MFGIGMSEMLIILAVALLVFGPAKLPDVAKSIARGLRELRKAGDDLRASIDLDVDNDRPQNRGRPSQPLPSPSQMNSSPPSDAAVPESPQSGVASMTGPEPLGRSEGNPTPEVWPRAALGTLARGSLDDGDNEKQAPPAPLEPGTSPGPPADDGVPGAEVSSGNPSVSSPTGRALPEVS